MSHVSCEQFRQVLLEADLDQSQRDMLLAALTHVHACADCQRVLPQQDAIRGALRESDDNVEPEGGWADFEQRMDEVIARGMARPRLKRYLAAAAMVLLCAGGGIWFALGHAQSPRPATELTMADVGGSVRAFQEVSKVFDKKAEFLVLTNGGGDIGLGASEVAGTDRPLVTRLVVLSDGKAISSTDVVFAAGQNAKVKVALPRGRSIEFLVDTQAGNPSRLGLSAEVQSAGQALASFTTQLDLPGAQMVSAGQITTAYGNYEVRVGMVQWRKAGREL